MLPSTIQVMVELLRGMAAIKLACWEPAFARRAATARHSELSALAVRKYLDALCVYFWAATSLLFSLLTFGLYVVLGGTLTADVVFTSLALFNVLIAPLNSFPWVVNGVAEGLVSARRLQQFLRMPASQDGWLMVGRAGKQKHAVCPCGSTVVVCTRLHRLHSFTPIIGQQPQVAPADEDLLAFKAPSSVAAPPSMSDVHSVHTVRQRAVGTVAHGYQSIGQPVNHTYKQVVSIDAAGIDAVGSSDQGDSRGPASPDPSHPVMLTVDRPRGLSRGLSRDSLPALTGIPEAGGSMPTLEEGTLEGGVRRVSSLSQALGTWRGLGGELGGSGRGHEAGSDHTSEGLTADLDATLRTWCCMRNCNYVATTCTLANTTTQACCPWSAC